MLDLAFQCEKFKDDRITTKQRSFALKRDKTFERESFSLLRKCLSSIFTKVNY